MSVILFSTRISDAGNNYLWMGLFVRDFTREGGAAPVLTYDSWKRQYVKVRNCCKIVYIGAQAILVSDSYLSDVFLYESAVSGSSFRVFYVAWYVSLNCISLSVLLGFFPLLYSNLLSYLSGAF